MVLHVKLPFTFGIKHKIYTIASGKERKKMKTLFKKRCIIFMNRFESTVMV